MVQRLTDSRLANLGATAIHEAFNRYQARFKAITRQAEARFQNRDWRGMQTDAVERLDLYRAVLDQIVSEIRGLLDDRLNNKLVWASMKAVYSSLILGHHDWEIAETFFNSVSRRIFATIGVDPQIEFVNSDFKTPPTQAEYSICHNYQGSPSLTALIRRVLTDYRDPLPLLNPEHDADLIASQITAHMETSEIPAGVRYIEMLKSVFYRGMGAYLIGRISIGSQLLPLVIALLHTSEGIVVDGVLLNSDAVSILFSFTRSHFHVEADRPYDLVSFLKTIIPRKRIAELYIAIGHTKHGKTVLYRELQHHLSVCCLDQFEISRGKRGMVMIVFNLPNDDLVFKLIKDRFNQPKHTTRQQVIGKYEFVFKHDRAGRLVEAQTFEHLEFDICCFSDELLGELKRKVSQMVRMEGDHVIVGHAYVERRVTPLDVYLQEADNRAARAAILDYGRAIRDLALSNIFPGDMLLNNFGVTRHGRVVFYDYDELCRITDCNFRRIPPAANPEDELAGEPWFYVGENDVFPEELPRFLGLPDDLHKFFMENHSDLFDVDFWRGIQERLQSGELVHIFPYARIHKARGLK